MFFWNSLAFSMLQQMLAIWSLVPLPFLNPAWMSGSSQFTHSWSQLGEFWVVLCQCVKWVHLCGSLNILQFSSVAQSCPTLCDPMNRSTPGLPVHHQLADITQTHVHRVSDAIQPSHPLSSPSPAFNLSQHQGLLQRVRSSHQVTKVLEFQLQHQSFQRILRTDLL